MAPSFQNLFHGLILAVTAASSFCSAETFVGSLSNVGGHDVAGDVYLLSERVAEIRNFGFDGRGPGVYWWLDKSANPSRGGRRVEYLSEAEGMCIELVTGFAADGTETVRVELKEGESFKDYLGGSLGLWCEVVGVNFGDVVLPASEEGILAADAVATQCGEGGDAAAPATPDIEVETPEGFNCEELSEDLQVRWRVLEGGAGIEYDLVGRIEGNQYMAFGRSGSATEARMIGADVVLADAVTADDGTKSFRARDMFLSQRGPCVAGSGGVCPDVDFAGTNDAMGVTGEFSSGVTRVTYTRSITPADTANMVSASELASGMATVDQPVPLNEEVAVVWAIGPVNPENGLPAIHTAVSRSAILIDFNRTVADNCVPLELEEDTGEVLEPFDRPVLGPDQTEFTAHIGPSGGDRGFLGISGGSVAWGIAWYIEGELIPTIRMRRGTKYTFRVNGGDDPSIASSYHPLYLTTNQFGGYADKTPEERAQETVFAGLTFLNDDGTVAVSRQASANFRPDAAGPLCLYDATDATDEAEANLSDYDIFRESLDRQCTTQMDIVDNAGVLEFTPDENTPDTIYYQCVTHQHLGWKIEVVDADFVEGEDSSAAGFGLVAALLVSMGALFL